MVETQITTPFDAATTAVEVLEGVDLTGRRMIVTGGASGIGGETVRALAGASAGVTVATRNPESASDLIREIRRTRHSAAVRAVEIDLADLNSIRAFVGDWQGPLDALVANAGIMALPTRETTRQGWELQLATNYLGHFALAVGLHDNLRAANSARVVVVSSTAQLRSPFNFDDPHFEHRPYDRWSAYAQSKTADALLAVGISRHWAADGITANALMPGWITTNLQRHLDDDTLRSMGAMDEHGTRIERDHFKSPAQGAATSTLLAGSPLMEGVTGRYFEDNQGAETVSDGEGHSTGVAAHSLDPVSADRLWAYASTAVSMS